MEELKALFANIGWQEEFEEAIQEGCSQAYLHGLADSSYDEWGAANVFMNQVCREEDCYPCDVELWHLEERFPNVQFKDSDYGFQYFRGRLFSLADYQRAKELIEQFRDKFSESFSTRSGNCRGDSMESPTIFGTPN